MLFRTIRLVVACLVTAGILAGCSDDSSEPEDEALFEETVSMRVTTYEDGSLEHPDGVTVSVPRFAVPLTESGEEGALHFFVDSGADESNGIADTPWDESQPVSVTAGIGPEGYILELPLRTTMSIADSVDLTRSEVLLFGYDREENRWRSIGGQIDVEERTIESDLLFPMPVVAAMRTASDSAQGAIRIEAMDDYGFVILIDLYTRTYIQHDESFDPSKAFRFVAPRTLSFGSAETAEYWALPQGGYRLAIAVYRFNPSDSRDMEYLGYFNDVVNIVSPHWDRAGGGEPYEFAVTLDDFSSWIDSGSLSPERPAGMGTVIPGYSSEELRVQLEWYAHADLDLWVTDPCGTTIYYDTPMAVCDESEGRLVADNGCPWFTPGKPETIVWGGKVPWGEYTVYVDYFRDCGNAGEVFYTIRWMKGTEVKSTNGFISPPEIPGMQDDEKRVASFVIE